MPRPKHKYHYLYKTTNMINGKYYVGMHSTSDMDDEYLGSGKRLKYSIKKYGKENFNKEIIKFFESREELNKAEMEMVTETIINDPLCMNLMIGGKGGNVGYSIEQYRAWGLLGARTTWEKIKNDKNLYAIFIKRKSDNLKKLWSEGKLKQPDWVGKKHKNETINKMKLAKIGYGLGETNSQYNTCWVFNIELKMTKQIKKEELEIYLVNGWLKGRKMKFK